MAERIVNVIGGPVFMPFQSELSGVGALLWERMDDERSNWTKIRRARRSRYYERVLESSAGQGIDSENWPPVNDDELWETIDERLSNRNQINSRRITKHLAKHVPVERCLDAKLYRGWGRVVQLLFHNQASQLATTSSGA